MFLKPRVYAAKPRTLVELKTAIRENIQELGEKTLVKVEANFRNRLQIFAHENKMAIICQTKFFTHK